jgi:hypothetical protein
LKSLPRLTCAFDEALRAGLRPDEGSATVVVPAVNASGISLCLEVVTTPAALRGGGKSRGGKIILILFNILPRVGPGGRG